MGKYQVEDILTGRKYLFEGNREPREDEIENYLQGTITAEKPSVGGTIQKFEKATLGEEGYKSLDTGFSKAAQTAVQAPFQWITRQMSRPTSAIKALTAGDNPVKGWINPEQYSFPSADIIPIEAWGIKPGTEQDFWVRALAGFAADLGTLHAVYGVVPKLGIEKYKGAQKVEFGKFKGVLREEFQKAGMGEASSAVSAELTAAHIMENSRILQRTPWNIAKSTEALKNNPGKLAEIIKHWAGISKTKVDQLGYTNWAEKAGEELQRYEGWLKSREPTQRPALNVPLHPAPAVSVDYTKPVQLTYPGVPKSIVKDLPTEVIAPPTQEEAVKTLSRFPQKVVDQKSLEEVGNAMAKEMGIQVPIKWVFKIYDKKYISGSFTGHLVLDVNKPDSIVIRVPKDKLSLTETQQVLALKTAGGKGKIGELVPTQGKIKKVILEELVHKLNPHQNHNTIFSDELGYHEATTLIKKELRKKQVIQPTGEGKVTPKITFDDLINDPDLADKILANPLLAYNEEALVFAKEIVRDYSDKTPPSIPLEKVKEVSDGGIAAPVVNEPIKEPITQTPVVETPKLEPTEQGIYNPTQNYNVTYLKANGLPLVTTIKGNLLNTMDQALKVGKNSIDPYGHIITKIVDVYPIRGDSGQFTLPEWQVVEDLLTNIGGEAQVKWEHTKNWMSKFAIPEKVDNPLFKPIYNAVQIGMDYNTELKITGLKLLNTEETLKGLTDADQAGLSMVVKLGNALKLEYTPDQLKTQFNFNDRQITAYNNFRRFYRYTFSMVEKSKKLYSEYENLKPEDKVKFDEAFAKTKANLMGYVSQERLGSGEKPWAVYVPPLEGETQPQFFSVFENKADAERTAKALGSVDYAYLRKNIVHKVIQRVSLADLEELLDSAGVENTVEAQALRDELKKRGVLHHEVRRMDIPGYEWNWKNVIDSAIDYGEGAANRLSRTFGKKLGDKIYQHNAGQMSTEMKIFSRDFIDAAYNSGNIGFRNVSKFLYTMHLALNTKNLVLNLTQPITRTYPFMARYLKTGECEATFAKAYGITGRYLKHVVSKEATGFSSDLLYSLNKLHNQGVLGDQATRLMMGVNTIKGEQFEKIIGAYGRFGEFINRTHAAVAGYYIGTEKLGLTGKPLVEFMRESVYRTQVAYGKHNLPLVLKQMGRFNSFLKMLYTFQHYNLDNLQYLGSTMPWTKGAKAGETFRALGALVVLSGVMALPFLGTGKMLYKLFKGKITGKGGTLEDDLRTLMSSKKMPKGLQDTILGGTLSLVGADMTASIRPDLPFVDPSGNVSLAGAPGGMVDKVYQAGVLLMRGETGRASEKISPRALESILKAIRVNREGLKTQAGVPIVPEKNISWWDKALIGMGFQPKVVSKAYTREEVERSLMDVNRSLTSEYYNKLAKARIDRDHKKALEIYREIRERNKKLPREARININSYALDQKVNLMKGRGGNVPVKMRRKFRELERTYGGRR